MPKMTPQERETIETAMRWQSHQRYDRSTILMLMGHIEAVEWEHEAQVKINRQLVDLEKEREVEDRDVTVPRDVAASLDFFRDNSTDNRTVLVSIANENFTGPYIKTLRNYSMTNFDNMLSAMINGYTVEQTPDDYVFEQYLDFLGNWQHVAADAIEMVLERLGGKTELLQKMHAVERPLPF